MSRLCPGFGPQSTSAISGNNFRTWRCDLWCHRDRKCGSYAPPNRSFRSVPQSPEIRHKQKVAASEQSVINGVIAVPVKAQSRKIGQHCMLAESLHSRRAPGKNPARDGGGRSHRLKAGFKQQRVLSRYPAQNGQSDPYRVLQ